jgi:endonuclease YncB( thermonuclease family)
VASTAFSAAEIAGRASVIDGDTIEIHGQRIRFFGIDAPESQQLCQADGKPYRCGQQAALALSDHVAARPITCERRNVDRYGRVVAVCSAADEDLNAWMVRQGWALAYRHYSTAYVADEEAAHVARLGIWRGTFEAPWDWRRDHGKPLAANDNATNAAGCRIKGNISSSGERVYHMPRGRLYDATRIDTAKGEQWFCSEAEAQAAGWRKSKQ